MQADKILLGSYQHTCTAADLVLMSLGKLAMVTEREDNNDDSLHVSTHRQGWLKCLEDYCVELKGRQVVWQKKAALRGTLVQSLGHSDAVQRCKAGKTER